MKLYTEEQVKKAIAYARSVNVTTYENPTIERVLNSLTPIELPSRNIADEASLSNSVESNIDFINGFIWTIRQILNQNK
jgi:hypothetical protein